MQSLSKIERTITRFLRKGLCTTSDCPCINYCRNTYLVNKNQRPKQPLANQEIPLFPVVEPASM